MNFNKPCNFKDTFFKIDAIKLVDVANNFVGKIKQEAGFGQIFNERGPHKALIKVSFFDKIDSNGGIVDSVSIYLT